ncbi:hypothetical protein MLD38_026346 [Melastoma candidum]|uniref:Uncharacterized protein n=1 Tax=Melastoma candidum TaxID=119954 RepID=A0ACB9P1T2_9MYRT|nr:hypothetical protein MLD38_026346 [Melastoma candidum]
MSVVLADYFAHGPLLDVHWSLFRLIVVYFVSVITVTLADLPVTGMHTAVNYDFTRSDNFKSNRPWSRQMSPQIAQVTGLTPAHSPIYGPLITSGHPPTSSRLSGQSTRSSSSVPPTLGLTDIAPSHSGSGAAPTALAEPSLSPNASNCCNQNMVLIRGREDCHCVYPIKLDLLLINISQNPDWNIFLQEFAAELGLDISQIELMNFYLISLSNLNISMDITPLSGISFSKSDASAINTSLFSHKIHLSSTLVGDYQLLNFTWFEAPPRSEVPSIAPAPMAVRPNDQTSTRNNSSNGGKSSNLVLIIGVASGLAVVVVLVILILCVCTFKWGKRKPKEAKAIATKNTEIQRAGESVAASVSLPHPSSTRILPYEELREATNNFAQSSILGEGGFGRVFKGVLSDGTAVAIKRLTSGGQQGDKEFLVEVEMLSRLHHRNLVKLVGYYSSPDSSQHLLCYELVPNGSLESWLHGPLGINCPLNWDTRMKIALDAARGLAYLHEDSQPCVIHRDFKASNILLENNFHAKVADFGLAKQAPEGRANYLSTRVMGTFGYVAPEYAMTGHLLVKSDVYSYGVVLLELLSGRKPVDMSQPSGQENLVTWARPILRDKERLEELADPRLGGNYPKEDFVRVCTIAAACVAPEANQRPTMGEVVQSLKMVQRVAEYQDTMLTPSVPRPNFRQSSTTFESDGTSSMFSSGPYSGVSGFDNENISRTAVFSEDLHEGR